MNELEIYGEAEFDYILYTPKDYDGVKKYPILFFLHGAGERGDDLNLVKHHGVSRLFEEGKTLQAVVVCPQCKAEKTWNSDPVKLKKFFDRMIEKYAVNADMVSITGLSMGGFGTWQMIMDYPEFFSAAAPVCGGGLSWRAYRAKDLPIRIFHGEMDNVVPAFYSKEFYRVLQENGAKDTTLTLYPTLWHNCWDEAYGETDVLEWLISKKRNS